MYVSKSTRIEIAHLKEDSRYTDLRDFMMIFLRRSQCRGARWRHLRKWSGLEVSASLGCRQFAGARVLIAI